MGVLNIIMQATSFLFGTKNIKGKALAVWGGAMGSLVVYPVLESMKIIPEGFGTRMEDFNVPGYVHYWIGGFFLLWACKDNIKNWLASIFTSNGRRDALIEKLKDDLEISELYVKIARSKKDLKDILNELGEEPESKER